MWTHKQAPTSCHPSIYLYILISIHTNSTATHTCRCFVSWVLGSGFWVLGGWVVLAPSGVALINSESVLRVLPKGQICVHDSCPVVKWACYGCPYSLAPHCRKLWKIFPNKSGKTSCPSENTYLLTPLEILVLVRDFSSWGRHFPLPVLSPPLVDTNTKTRPVLYTFSSLFFVHLFSLVFAHLHIKFSFALH